MINQARVVKPTKRDTIRIYREFTKNPLLCLENLLRDDIDMYHLSMLGKSFYLVLNPEIIEQILVHHYEIFDKTLKGVDSYKGKTLMAPPGDKIRKKVHIARSKLTRDYQQRYLTSMQSILEEEINRLGVISECNKPINIHQEIEYIMLRIIFREFLSIEIGEEYRQICHDIHNISLHIKQRALALFKIPKFIPTKANRKFKAQSKRIDDMAHEVITTRMNLEEKPDDLLTKLVTKRTPNGELRSYTEMYNDLLTLFPAAYETPAKAILFSLYNILVHPEIYEKVNSEVLNTHENYNLLNLIIEETLRLYPPVWTMSRTNTKSVVVKGVEIPSGSVFLFSQYQIHRHPSYWNKPSKFDPYRFMQEDQPKHPYAYFPFGGGPSRCVGRQFAYKLIPEIIRTLLLNFDINLEDPSKPLVLDMGVTLFPKYGLSVYLQRKDGPVVTKPTKEKIIVEGQL